MTALSFKDRQRRAEKRRLAEKRPALNQPQGSHAGRRDARAAFQAETDARVAATLNPALSKRAKKAIENQRVRDAAARAAAYAAAGVPS